MCYHLLYAMTSRIVPIGDTDHHAVVRMQLKPQGKTIRRRLEVFDYCVMSIKDQARTDRLCLFVLPAFGKKLAT